MVLNRRLTEAGWARNSSGRVIVVVDTGVGSHSGPGGAVLRPWAKDLLERRGYEFREAHGKFAVVVWHDLYYREVEGAVASGQSVARRRAVKAKARAATRAQAPSFHPDHAAAHCALPAGPLSQREFPRLGAAGGAPGIPGPPSRGGGRGDAAGIGVGVEQSVRKHGRQRKGGRQRRALAEAVDTIADMELLWALKLSEEEARAPRALGGWGGDGDRGHEGDSVEAGGCGGGGGGDGGGGGMLAQALALSVAEAHASGGGDAQGVVRRRRAELDPGRGTGKWAEAREAPRRSREGVAGGAGGTGGGGSGDDDDDDLAEALAVSASEAEAAACEAALAGAGLSGWDVATWLALDALAAGSAVEGGGNGGGEGPGPDVNADLAKALADWYEKGLMKAGCVHGWRGRVVSTYNEKPPVPRLLRLTRRDFDDNNWAWEEWGVQQPGGRSDVVAVEAAVDVAAIAANGRCETARDTAPAAAVMTARSNCHGAGGGVGEGASPEASAGGSGGSGGGETYSGGGGGDRSGKDGDSGGSRDDSGSSSSGGGGGGGGASGGGIGGSSRGSGGSVTGAAVAPLDPALADLLAACGLLDAYGPLLAAEDVDADALSLVRGWTTRGRNARGRAESPLPWLPSPPWAVPSRESIFWGGGLRGAGVRSTDRVEGSVPVPTPVPNGDASPPSGAPSLEKLTSTTSASGPRLKGRSSSTWPWHSALDAG